MNHRIVIRYCLILLSAVIIIVACRRDNNSDINPPAQVDDITQVQTSVSGNVVDEKGFPVEGALVRCGNSTFTTDRYGAFQFTNINLSKNNGFVKVEKTGYFNAYRSFVTASGTMNQVRIRLLPRSVNGTITSTSGGSVMLSGGAKLTLPANAVTEASGNVYNGTVNVSMTWINPTDPNLPDIVMGDLRGITTGGEERGLETFGMIGVELKGSSGQELKIKAGQKADLTFPIPTALLANAPNTIDLWHFDETKARWVQEGTATKSGSNYLAQVTHFSFWNCDAPFPLVEFCARLVDSLTGKPLNNVGVRIVRANGNPGFGRTDTAGNICGKIPRNEPLKLQVLNPCNQASSSYNIGPFSSNTSLGTIKVATPSTTRIVFTGTVKDCNNAPVTKGYVRIYAGNSQVYTANVVNGVYELAIIKCNNEPVNYSVTAIDLNAVQQNVPITVTATSGNVTIPVIQACGTSSAQFIEILIDGTPYNIVSPPDQITTIDSILTGSTGGKMSISGGKGTNSGSTVSNNINFNFIHNGTVANGLPLNRCFIFISQTLFSEQILTQNPTINLTKYNSFPGSVAEGNFTVDMNFQGTTRNVKCTFRVIKR
ncbi:MAG: carboxypeptidase-like regulatory domain-containing protein [Bacteroidota bacterium]